MSKKLLTTFLFLIWRHFAVCQQPVLAGKVMGIDGGRISYASVSITDSTQQVRSGGFSDEEGQFSIAVNNLFGVFTLKYLTFNISRIQKKSL